MERDDRPRFDTEEVGQLDKVQLTPEVRVDLGNFHVDACFRRFFFLLLLIARCLVHIVHGVPEKN